MPFGTVPAQGPYANSPAANIHGLYGDSTFKSSTMTGQAPGMGSSMTKNGRKKSTFMGKKARKRGRSR